jgi:hypothetical protein
VKTSPAQDEMDDDEEFIAIPDFLFESKPEKNALLQELLASSDKLERRLVPIAEAFIHNLRSVYQLLSLPFGLVFQGSEDAWLWSNIFMNLGHDHPGSGFPVMRMTESAFKEVVARAYDKARDNVDGAAVFFRMNLAKVSGKVDFVSASLELLNQGLVLIWSSFELLVGDVLCATLNAVPGIVGRVLSDPSAKRYLNGDKISMELLSEYGFDLSSAMGTALLRDLNLSSIRKMKAISSALFNSIELRKAFESHTLYLLSERRHLIVHRRGIVDAKYVRNAGDGRTEGEHLQIGKGELAIALEEVAGCGLSLLRAADEIVLGGALQE